MFGGVLFAVMSKNTRENIFSRNYSSSREAMVTDWNTEGMSEYQENRFYYEAD